MERLAEIRAVLEMEGRHDARFVVEVKDDESGCGGGAGGLLRDEESA